MTSEKKRQTAKEKAVLLTLQHSLALIQRNLKIDGWKKDESLIFISKSKKFELLWPDYLKALQVRFK